MFKKFFIDLVKSEIKCMFALNKVYSCVKYPNVSAFGGIKNEG